MPSIAGIKAGDAYVTIGALDDTGKMLSKIGRRIKMWGASLTGLGTDILFKGALAAVPGVAMLRWATDFDDMMKRVQARTGATDAQMNTLRKTAMEAGLDIGFTARDIGKIFDTLSQNKFDIGDIEQMARPIALLTKATGGGGEKDTEQATRLMAQTLNSFQLGSDSAQMVADLMAVAANKSSFALDDLTEAMAKVGPMAKAMGVGIVETVGVMAMMRNVEIEAETAGVSMRNIFLNASDDKNVKKFNDKLEALGQTVIKFTDDAGNLKHPAQLLFEVFNKVKGLGTAQRANLLGELFGKRAAVPAIAAGMSQEAFDEFMKALKNAAGEATRVSLEMEMGLGGAFRAIRNGVEQIAIVFGETLKPMMGSIREIIVSLTQRIKAWIELNPRLAAGVMLVAASVMTTGAALIVFGTTMKIVGFAIGSLGFTLTALQAALTVTVGVIGFAVSAIIGIIGIIPAAFGVAVTLMTGLASLLGSIFYGIGAVLAAALTAGTATISAPLLATIAAVMGVAAAAVIAYYGIKAIVDVGVSGFTSMIRLIGQVADKLQWAFQAIAARGLAVWEILREGMGAAFKLAAVGKFQLAWEVATASLKVSFLELKDSVILIFQNIANSFRTMLDEMMVDWGMSMIEMVRSIPENNATHVMRAAMEEGGLALTGGTNDRELALLRKEAARADTKEANNRAFLARDKEIQAARKAFKEKMNEVVPDLQDADKVFDDLKDRMKKAMAGFGGEGAGVKALADEHIPALTEMQAGTLEAAKSAYEASTADEFGNIQGQMLGVQQQIAENTGRLVDNLGIA